MNKKNLIQYLCMSSIIGLTACGTGGAPRMNADGVSIMSTKNKLDMSQTGISAGDEALSQGKYEVASEMYGKAWSIKPSEKVAIRYGHALRLSGDYEKAVIVMKSANDQFPGNVDILTELARDSLAGGFQDTARDALTKAVATGHAHWDTYMTYGAYYARENQLEKSLEMFQKAESLSTTDYNRNSAKANIAMANIQSGHVKEGMMQLRELSTEPGIDPKIHANLALMLGLNGDYSDFEIQALKANMSPSDVRSIKNWLSGEEKDEIISGGNSVITDSKGQSAQNKNDEIEKESKESLQNQTDDQIDFGTEKKPGTLLENNTTSLPITNPSTPDVMSENPDSIQSVTN